MEDRGISARFSGVPLRRCCGRREVPMLIIHNSGSSLPPPRMLRMLLSTDFSPASAAGEEWLQYLTQHGVREVVLVHAIENPLLDVYSPDTADLDLKHVSEESRQHPPRSAQPYWENAMQVAEAKLSQLRQQLLAPPLLCSGQKLWLPKEHRQWSSSRRRNNIR